MTRTTKNKALTKSFKIESEKSPLPFRLGHKFFFKHEKRPFHYYQSVSFYLEEKLRFLENSKWARSPIFCIFHIMASNKLAIAQFLDDGTRAKKNLNRTSQFIRYL